MSALPLRRGLQVSEWRCDPSLCVDQNASVASASHNTIRPKHCGLCFLICWQAQDYDITGVGQVSSRLNRRGPGLRQLVLCLV